MHARELIELAALVASHGAALVESNGRLSATGLEQYWVANKCRAERWMRTLKAHSDALDRLPAELQRGSWRATLPTLEEILISEPLSRVWTAVVVAFDVRRQNDEGAAIVRSVHLSHLEARRRALALLMGARGLD